jgi:phospholipase/carboxylesterase
MPVFEPVLAALDAKLGAIALRAQDEVWFPEDWAAPAAAQEPYASNALDLIHRTIEGLPVPASKVILMGFSQGASVLYFGACRGIEINCPRPGAALAMTYALKYPRRYGGIISLSGHILGTPSDYPATKASTLEGTPVYIAWGSQDRYMKCVSACARRSL